MVGGKERRKIRRRIIFWPDAISAGGSSVPPSLRRTSVPNTSSDWRERAPLAALPLAHYELHAWCLLVLAWVFVPFYMRSMVFTMPEFLERRFSSSSRYVLSIVSIITFIVSKIAVGIFAGGVVFGTLLPELHITIGHSYIDSFWIGSVLVIALTGLYTALGGMRAVAYNDAVQTFVLILGSASLTFYGLHKLGGWHELRYWCGSEMFNLWKPMIPRGARHVGACALERTRRAK